MKERVNFIGKMGLNISGNLKKILYKEKADGNGLMVMYMKEILKMGNLMAMASKKKKMGKYMWVISKMINMKAKV